jgi:uncharacterized membrane protein (DUF373 family)
MKRIRKAVDMLITLMIPLVIAALMLGIARTFLDLRVVLQSPGMGKAFDLMVSNILSTFVVVELLRSVLDYFELHRLKITYITDAAIVFVLREIMIGLYGHSMGSREVVALAVLILVLGGVRTLAVLFSPKTDREVMTHE